MNSPRRRRPSGPAHGRPQHQKSTKGSQSSQSVDWRPGQTKSQPKPAPSQPAPPRRSDQPPLPARDHRRDSRHSAAPPASKPLPPPRAAPQAAAPSAPSSPELHWRDALGPLVAGSTYQPLDEKGLARKLGLAAHDTQIFSEFLVAEEATGRIMREPSGLYVSPKKLGLCVGHLMMNERGFGFVVPTDPAEADFYVAGEDTANALHGDLVVARLIVRRGQREGRIRGEVVRVLRRKRRQLVGTLEQTPQFLYVRPDETRIPFDIVVAAPAGTPPLGQKVVVQLDDWPDRRRNPSGVITEVLGAPDAPGVDLISIIRKHDLPTSFPEAVEQEAADIPAQIAPDELARREDFRPIFTLTIDPDDAKDFDDALSYQVKPNGDFEIFVHIADVSHYVRPGAALDTEARGRGNSVYLVDRVIPMLPEKLSNGICSLQPRVDRLVKTAIITLDRQGEIKSHRFAEGIIHSAERLTYQEAFALLQKPAASPLGRDLHALNDMAQTLRRRRFAKGALDLDFPEVKVRVDELGIPLRLEKTENDVSHQLIEEFMLLANEVVALEMKRRHRPGIYRIHENPDPDRLLEFRTLAKSMGFPCGDLTQKGEIQKLLERVRGQAGEAAVKIGLLKSLKRAMYSPKPLGHYGLSKLNYAHFTSPIRRYADLVVHRVIFPPKNDARSVDYDTLSRLALHLSNTERTASEAEQESVKLKKLEYFAREAKSTQHASFPAIVLEVRASGLVVQVPEFVVQGLVPMSGAAFVFNAQRLELLDVKTKTVFRAGQNVQVEVASVDLVRNQIDFKLVTARASKNSTEAASHGNKVVRSHPRA